ncbi:hypothetical protein [Sediminicoccus sp. KRV36]|uniref:hypothetical protein n=1 Tax=Sediminicoccus sp. KRV36 TaxID=3133721 RepID=UPI00200C73BF|nr:hypothetical protein [Sediminicoccus rosea]UPY37032.1 hypothetical protein LHU95_22915 [Sediminicoccus rosea]
MVSTAGTSAEIEPLIYDLTGAACLAALVLEAIREDGSRATSTSVREALGWLDNRLTVAAENMLAVHEDRATHWFTMMENDSIRKALDRAAERGEARETARAARAWDGKDAPLTES